MSSAPRPLSPHLTIYKPQLTSILSITHRMTGVALAVGTALMVAWLWTAAYNPGFYSTLHEYLHSCIGQLLLAGWTLAFFYHLANGIRHLFWDIGKGFSLPAAYRSGWLVVAFALLMTAATWYFIYYGAAQ